MKLNEIHDLIEEFVEFAIDYQMDSRTRTPEVFNAAHLKGPILDEFLAYKEKQ